MRGQARAPVHKPPQLSPIIQNHTAAQKQKIPLEDELHAQKLEELTLQQQKRVEELALQQQRKMEELVLQEQRKALQDGIRLLNLERQWKNAIVLTWSRLTASSKAHPRSDSRRPRLAIPLMLPLSNSAPVLLLPHSAPIPNQSATSIVEHPSCSHSQLLHLLHTSNISLLIF